MVRSGEAMLHSVTLTLPWLKNGPQIPQLTEFLPNAGDKTVTEHSSHLKWH